MSSILVFALGHPLLKTANPRKIIIWKKKVALVAEALCCSGSPNKEEYFNNPNI